MMKLHFLPFLLFFALLINPARSSSGNKAVQVIVKGTVTDKFTGKPVGVTLEFRTQDGKKFKIKSNSMDGTYQQVFDAGSTVDVVMTSFDIARKVDKLVVKDAEKFEEITHNFTVEQFKIGTSYLKLDVFQPMQSDINSSLQQRLKELDDVMKFNRAVKFEIVVTAHDSYARITVKEVVKPAKKGKKAQAEQVKTSVREPDMQAVKALADKRAAAIREYISRNFPFKDRITVKADYSVLDSSSDASLATTPDVNMVVSELKNMLE